MKLSKILEEKIALRIADSPNEVFMRKDFNDLADYNQVGRSLRQLVVKGIII